MKNKTQLATRRIEHLHLFSRTCTTISNLDQILSFKENIKIGIENRKSDVLSARTSSTYEKSQGVRVVASSTLASFILVYFRRIIVVLSTKNFVVSLISMLFEIFPNRNKIKTQKNRNKEGNY